MNKTTVFVALAALAALACGPDKGRETAKTMQPGFMEYTCDGAFFKAQVPSSWKMMENVTTGRQAKEYGADFAGPSNKDGAYTRISIIYYGADHARMTFEKYLDLNSKPDPLLPIAGEAFGQVQDFSLAGRAAKAFDRKTFDFIPPYAVNPKKVPVYERKVVLRGEKGGFYALTLHVPADISREFTATFDKVLDGFSPAR
ncbi:MAG: hypothetical protein ACYC2I_08580 [Elusimicrobiales bacterium]